MLIDVLEANDQLPEELVESLLEYLVPSTNKEDGSKEACTCAVPAHTLLQCSVRV